MADTPLSPIKKPVPRVPLRTHDSARRTLSSFIRAFRRGELDKDTFRCLVYGMTALLGYFRFKADLDIERRLDEIEKTLSEDHRS